MRRNARFYILSKRGTPIRADGSDVTIEEWDKRHSSRVGLSSALYFNRLEKAIKAAKKFGGKVAKSDAIKSHYGQWHLSGTFSPLSKTSKRVSFLKNPRRKKRYVRKNSKRHGKRRASKRSRRNRRSRR